MADAASLQEAIKALQELMDFKEAELAQFEEAIAAIEDDITTLRKMSRNLFRQFKSILNTELGDDDN